MASPVTIVTCLHLMLLLRLSFSLVIVPAEPIAGEVKMSYCLNSTRSHSGQQGNESRYEPHSRQGVSVFLLDPLPDHMAMWFPICFLEAAVRVLPYPEVQPALRTYCFSPQALPFAGL